MTLNLSENSWAKAGLIIALVLAVIGVWAYLAGGIFLMAYDPCRYTQLISHYK